MSSATAARLARANISLEGLSIGDAFGERFPILPALAEMMIRARQLPRAPWHFTDDTQMALSIVAILRQYQNIDQDQLAGSFAEHFDESRDYGLSMHRLLAEISAGEDWRLAAPRLFNNQGSYGNGAAMRVSPLGAYFADDLIMVVEQAQRSAVVTHAHKEAIAGAIAVALATAIAWQLSRHALLPTTTEFIQLLLPFVPESELKDHLNMACGLAKTASIELAVSILGNGENVSAQDTVPFAIWCASRSLNNYPEALWSAASAGGDRDTICAIVGGIVAMSSTTPIPKEWIIAREALPEWGYAKNSIGC